MPDGPHPGSRPCRVGQVTSRQTLLFASLVVGGIGLVWWLLYALV